MSLPASSATTRTVTVELSGGTVVVHPLTITQTRACRDASDENEADALCIAWSTDTDVAEAREWVRTADPADFRLLIDAIGEVSKLGKDAQFPQ